MKSIVTFTVVLLITLTSLAQEKLSTRSGILKFEASTENFEPVTATNKTASAILKDDGSLAVMALIKGFQFKVSLMQKHFNQPKFMDSSKYPKTSFSGNLVDYNGKDGEYKINGDLLIHGVTNKISSTATIKNVDDVVYLSANFSVLVADYGIAIKSKLAKKIAETVNIDVNLELK